MQEIKTGQTVKVWQGGKVKEVELEHMGLWSSKTEAEDYARVEGYSVVRFRNLGKGNFELLVAR